MQKGCWFKNGAAGRIVGKQYASIETQPHPSAFGIKLSQSKSLEKFYPASALHTIQHKRIKLHLEKIYFQGQLTENLEKNNRGVKKIRK